jgi:hypothetical protein
MEDEDQVKEPIEVEVPRHLIDRQEIPEMTVVANMRA